MAKQQILLVLSACCLLILSTLLSGVSTEIGDQNPSDVNRIESTEQQQQELRLPLPSPTSRATDWTEMSDDMHGLPPPMAMSLRLSKRAPNGFIGMRGKKEMAEETSPIVAMPSTSSGWLWSNVPMLAADAALSANAMRYKKSPSAFYGVRGKKYGAGSELTRINHMLHQLEQEHLREQLLQEFLDRVISTTARDNEIVSNEKRAPIGFTGVRGKRPNDDNNSNELNAINNSDENVNASDDDDGDVGGDGDDDDLLMLNKRGPSNAFLGVRGKKSVDEHQHYKRSPNEVYSGGSLGSGLRSGGKQQRFVDFGNKFVAVRGKKNSALMTAPVHGGGSSLRGALGGWRGSGAGGNSALRGMPSYEPPPWYGVLPAAALASLTSSSSDELFYNDADKRAPSGFVGMRGKRDASIAAYKIETDANTPTQRTPVKMLKLAQPTM